MSLLELKLICEPFQKAWFIINARSYLYSFMSVLEFRNEDISDIKEVIEYIDGEE